MKRFFVLPALTILLSSCNFLSQSAKPKNIILLVGDGMGPAAIKAYRMYKDDPNTPIEERLAFDDLLVGSINTSTLDTVDNITDSAASATAYATGHKTINGALSVDSNNNSFPTVFEKAKHLGMSTGIVVTSEVTHATPAAFATHIIDRDQKDRIADQYFDNQYQNQPIVDVLLGGGFANFGRKDRNLIAEFESKGYQFVDSKTSLMASHNDKLLGLFADWGLAKMFDRKPETPSLANMTRVALKCLAKNENGFLLVVEASQIDWAAHANDIVGVMSEMEDFELALKEVIHFAKKRQDTLVIATSDHVTGGLSVGSKYSGVGIDFWDTHVVKSFKYTPEKIVAKAQKSKDLLAEFSKASTVELTVEEIERLKQIDLSHFAKARRSVARIITEKSHTGWTTHGHTGEDVYLYAYGPQKEQLYGHWDNTKIGQFIFELLVNH